MLVLTMLYRPEPNFITADVAEAMARGARVTVVAAHPNYPLGRFYPQVRRPWLPSRSVENGVTVWRLPMVPDHSNSTLRRLVSYLSFTAAATLFAPFVAGRPGTVWVYQTPFTTALAALWFKLAFRSRVVYTCADLWPESFSATGVVRSGVLMRLAFGYSRLINRLADAIVCSTRRTLERYAADGVDRARLRYIPVWVDGSPRGALPDPAGEPAGDAVPTVVYAGNLGPAQALDTLVRAAGELHRAGVAVRFDLYGTGSSEGELKAVAAEVGAANVRFLGRAEPAAVFAACERALAQVVSLAPSPLFRMTVPSKLPFSFAAGAPVLYGLEGEAAGLAHESGGAVAFDPGDPSTLAAAVRRLLAADPAERLAMRRRLRAFYRENFSRERLLAEYAGVFADGAPPLSAATRERPRGRRLPLRRAAGSEG
jgi:glycosyltransferase involved in cell wall biosynthesis